ncbi:hypothetical protein CU664_10495 [Pseudomonas syringae pv. actinidifoliorum]|nr:hypothetical protein [Pseudomonas syringae pv. actinidifoliorum]NAT63688.1 hypothetical protein [Pseudomonas syringae pv. actinidifoliorum]
MASARRAWICREPAVNRCIRYIRYNRGRLDQDRFAAHRGQVRSYKNRDIADKRSVVRSAAI